MKQLFVIKVGGNILDNPELCSAFLDQLVQVDGAKMLVHGGGKIATSIGNKLGIESKYNEGRRITDEATLDLVTMVYGGLVNKQLVAALQARNCNAVGLTGADGNLMIAKKRNATPIDYGWVGDLNASGINTGWLQLLLQQGLVPVVAPLTHDGMGRMLNTNADTIAASLAIAMSSSFSVRLIYCFEKKGVLRDVQDADSVIGNLNKASYEELLQRGLLADGILPKLQSAFKAIDAGVPEILIGDAADLLQNTTGATAGTLISA